MADNSAEPISAFDGVTADATSAFDGVTEPAVPPAKIQNTDVLVLPRFFLMVALKENLVNLQENADRKDLEGFWDRLIDILKEIRQVVSKIEGGSELEGGILRAKDVVDTKLVPYLQSLPNMERILDSYLPRKGQTWEDFLQGKPDHERQLAMAELDIEGFQDNLPAIVLLYMDQFLKNVNEFRLFIARPELPPTDITAYSLPVYKKGKQSYELVTVYYATDRKLVNGEYKHDDLPLFPWQLPKWNVGKSTPASVPKDVVLPPLRPLEYGIAGVSIPSIHKQGVVESRGWLETENPYKHVMILRKHDQKLRGDEAKIFTILNKDITTGEHGLKNTKGDLLIFIHGYNNTHNGALKQAAQLKYDMDFKGAMVAYTWSSAGNLLGYFHDEVAIKNTVESLKGFLLAIMAKMEVPTRIHLLAHSMGNRAMIKALDLLHDGHQIPNLPNPRCPIATVISAAGDDCPDHWEDLLDKMKNVYPPIAEGKSVSRPLLSVYSSNDDWALYLSKLWHKEVRLGQTDRLFERAKGARVLTLDDHDVIDATGVDTKPDSNGHGYFGDTPKVIEDIHTLILNSVRANGRANLLNVQKLGFKFFAFIQSKWPTFITRPDSLVLSEALN